MQAQRADAAGDVQAGIAFDAERLQRNGAVRTLNQQVGAHAHAGGGAWTSPRRRGTSVRDAAALVKCHHAMLFGALQPQSGPPD